MAEKKVESADDIRARLKAIKEESDKLKADLETADKEDASKLSACFAKVKEYLAEEGIKSGTIVLNLDESTINRQNKGQGAPKGPRAPRGDLDDTTEADLVLDGAKAGGGIVILANGKKCSASRFLGHVLKDKSNRPKSKVLTALGFTMGQINGVLNGLRGTDTRKLPAK
jgi:hypothetical protein